MTDTKDTDMPSVKLAAIAWVDFLQEQPPGSVVVVGNAVVWNQQYGGRFELNAPEIQLFCPEPTCNSSMFFTSTDGKNVISSDWTNTFLTYSCRNCGNYSKTFSVAVRSKGNLICDGYKFGELPSFGPPIPARVLRLIGRRCENQGLGIGAVTYYRRVVENQWSRLVDEIIKVAQATGAPQATIDVLSASRDQHQFTKGVKDLKPGVPPSLMINGHNPLLLLHNALSQGVHNLQDVECLSLATSVRVILVELAEKLGQALKDEKELTDAVSRLLQIQTEKSSKQKNV
jgi:hypothetical protein